MIIRTVVVDDQARSQLVACVRTHVLGQSEADVVGCGNEVPVVEQVHAEHVTSHIEPRRNQGPLRISVPDRI